MRENAACFRKLKSFIREQCPQVRIADGESYTDISLLTSLAEQGLLDVWQPDVCGYGSLPGVNS